MSRFVWLPPTLALVLGACAVTVTPLPTKDHDRQSPVSIKTGPPVVAAQATATPAPETTPEHLIPPSEQPSEEPLPPLGLLLSGQVLIDTTSLLAAKIAEPTALGAKLISNNGPGLISDRGVGLISNNAGVLVAKTKYALPGPHFTLAQADTPASYALKPVQGMLVKAISLRTGELLAGPVATDAEGRYRLGFLKKPDSNLSIVAYVNNLETDESYTFAKLTAPEPAALESTPAADTLTTYMTKILSARLQEGIDKRKKGEDLSANPADFEDADEQKFVKDTNDVLSQLTPAFAEKLDQNGTTAKKFAERVISFVDLNKPIFPALEEAFEDLRQFEATQPVPGKVQVVKEVVALLSSRTTSDDVYPHLIEWGMPEARAKKVNATFDSASSPLNKEMKRIGDEHKVEVFSPLLEIEGLLETLNK